MKSTYDQIWESALRKLEIRSHSKAELLRKLSEKFPDDRGTILTALEEMERVQLLNDRRFTEEYVHHLIQKPIGRFKIMMECRKRGLDQDMVEQALLNADWSEEKAIEEAIAEKERVLHENDERKRRQKLVNFLKNRGFVDSTIFRKLR
ncbi:recombination regulator RecX [Patescibacteria group bacterium]|nr:recombination regulator RecX [Patescibacteria group bacterium]MBU1015502.1 recombination regulator RecX [Patescibacteria group bacterium]MBU1685425.1 recombination regulator RecX [Patescibacteria group bacterium]MBU1938386.1 recombination regulator RecX [Patescibacteria group bacterium]